MLQTQLAGRFKIDIVDPNGVVRETRDWQPNLVTDFGLNNLFERSTTPFIMLGAGATEPQTTDKQMESFVWLKSPDGGGIWGYAGYQKDGEYIYDYVVYHARFLNHHDTEKTLSEIGLGFVQYWYGKSPDNLLDTNYSGRWNSYSHYDSSTMEWPHVDAGTSYGSGYRYETRVCTHALIKGNGATVEPIALPAGWYLDVRYEVRRYYSLDKPTGTIQLTIDGQPKDFIYKCMIKHRNPTDEPDVTSGFDRRSTVAYMDLYYRNLLDQIGVFNAESNVGPRVYAYKESLDGVNPWENPGSNFDYADAGPNASMGWAEDYVSGSLKRKFYIYTGLPQLNKFKEDTIRTIRFGTSIGNWMIEFTGEDGKGLPKDETKEMRLEFELSVGRYTGAIEPRT